MPDSNLAPRPGPSHTDLAHELAELSPGELLTYAAAYAWLRHRFVDVSEPREHPLGTFKGPQVVGACRLRRLDDALAARLRSAGVEPASSFGRAAAPEAAQLLPGGAA